MAVTLGEAALSRKTAIAFILDELQYLKEAEFAALIFIGAGVPSILGAAGKAKSYAERLFDYPAVSRLSQIDANDALQIPAQRENAIFTQEALDAIYQATQGYPYFLQEWAYQA